MILCKESLMKMINRITLLLFIGLAFWSCEEPATIESKNAMTLLNNDAYYFLDVRTTEEHKIKSIPDTDCIPVQEIEKRIVELDKYRHSKGKIHNIFKNTRFFIIPTSIFPISIIHYFQHI